MITLDFYNLGSSEDALGVYTKYESTHTNPYTDKLYRVFEFHSYPHSYRNVDCPYIHYEIWDSDRKLFCDYILRTEASVLQLLEPLLCVP